MFCLTERNNRVASSRILSCLFFLPSCLLLAAAAAGCGQTQPAVSTTAISSVAAGGICGEDIDHSGTEFIRNGNFHGGLAGWQVVTVGPGTNLARARSDSSCGTALVLTREGAGNVTGLVGVEQPVRVDKDGLSSLEVQLVAIIEQQDLRSDGQLGGETPVFITLDYTTSNGQSRSWTHGLLLSGSSIKYPDRDEAIAPTYWHTYKSGNLLTMIPDLGQIQMVTVGGNGLDLNSKIALVSLLGKR